MINVEKIYDEDPFDELVKLLKKGRKASLIEKEYLQEMWRKAHNAIAHYGNQLKPPDRVEMNVPQVEIQKKYYEEFLERVRQAQILAIENGKPN